jgi:glycerol-3-phosphate cytidylyltransferase
VANVITYGTFDVFHVGHLRLLERAKALCGETGLLTVAVSSDRFNWEEKRKRCVISDSQRMEIVKALRCVDKVILEDSWEQKREDIKKYDIDIFVMGDDWEGKFDDLKDLCKVVYLPRTPGVSSTEIKEKCDRGNGK